MKLTICLVTKGRFPFLEESLRSYEQFLDTGLVNVLLIDNGADQKSRELLIEFKDRNSHLVNYIRSEINVPTPYYFYWEKIKSFNPDWIVFPGDDDKLVFDAFNNWISVLSKYPDMTAFATSAKIIDISGNATGLTRSPALFGLTNKVEQLSKSLYEPPFFWPGLYFKFNVVTVNVPQSRFVFDWWVGLQLVLSSKVHSTAVVGVEYRVHENQDSFQSSSRRKIFEGFHMLMDFLGSQNFISEIELMSKDEIISLLERCFHETPLYSQGEYVHAILREITLKILALPQVQEINSQIFEKYLLSSGILTKKSDLDNLFLKSTLKFTNSKGNVAIILTSGVCDKLKTALVMFNQNSDKEYKISCEHSKHSVGAVKIKCSTLDRSSIAEVADTILLSINSQLELNGDLTFIISPFEKLVLTHIRSFKLKFPKFILKNMIVIKQRLGR